MSAFAAVVRTVAVALWIGGMAALDFIDAPLRFATPALTRNQAVALGQAVFARFNRIEIVCGVAALAAAAAARSARWTIAVTAVMLILAAAQTFYLTPEITRLAARLDFVNRTPGDPRYAAIRSLHGVYAIVELAIFGGGLAVLAGWSLAARR
ncbi:MAG TPA: DUF4149 domain-containing protein [bacterium]|nr:DUF4149 domain-containing protein [bacterium]